MKTTQTPVASASRHTPGPWFANTMSDGSILIHPRVGISVMAFTPRKAFPEDIPNARLIAAAPELLEALRTAANTLAWAAQEAEARKSLPKAVIGGIRHHASQARTAIAKAEGRAE